ncbi:hypothetical protein B0H12DRAFT_1256566 [Mycena haematopus]|nr:hypothetical protein B0H12DRAFT_1256566 [Mycena haematopus]
MNTVIDNTNDLFSLLPRGGVARKIGQNEMECSAGGKCASECREETASHRMAYEMILSFPFLPLFPSSLSRSWCAHPYASRGSVMTRGMRRTCGQVGRGAGEGRSMIERTACRDPCTLASASNWVSSQVAHACETNVPFNKARSLSVINSTIQALQYYTLENGFLHSPDPLIPHDVNVRALLENVQKTTSTVGYKLDWDFNMAIMDAFNREADGHTVFTAACTGAFSFNLPFSIATLANTPFDKTAFPTFLVNYDFPNQGRAGLEDYFESIGVQVRPLDSSRVLAINGVDASTYLVNLATQLSIFDGLVGTYETVNPRYMRLMARYSADTVAGLYTLEVGRFGQRAFYPGANSVTVTLETAHGIKTVTIPWAATFIGSASIRPRGDLALQKGQAVAFVYYWGVYSAPSASVQCHGIREMAIISSAPCFPSMS